jgi:hypothetical protein
MNQTMSDNSSFCYIETSIRILLSLYAGIDTKILAKHLRSIAGGITSLHGLDEKLYRVLQERLNQEAREKQMPPVEYDDFLFRELNRLTIKKK